MYLAMLLLLQSMIMTQLVCLRAKVMLMGLVSLLLCMVQLGYLRAVALRTVLPR